MDKFLGNVKKFHVEKKKKNEIIAEDITIKTTIEKIILHRKQNKQKKKMVEKYMKKKEMHAMEQFKKEII